MSEPEASVSERVLVAAPYPTMRGEAAEATFALVRSLVDEGDDVLVASPRASAAHVVADPGGPRGAARLVALSAGRDRVIVRLDATAMRADADPLFALPGRLGLAAALRRARRAEVILDRVPSTVSRRWASLVLQPAATITVSSEPERDALVAAGIDRARVSVVLEAIGVTTRPLLPPEQAGATFEERMKARAAAFAPAADAAATRPLRHLPPLERPVIRSRKPGVAAIKRVQLQLLGWMIDWVIQHVNRLHHATIESIEASTSKTRS